MKINIHLFLLFLFFTNAQNTFSQEYTSYLIGSSDDVTPETSFAVCLMGGRTEQDDAMIRLLNASGGGDIVVLRISGGDGYNSYLHSELGVTVNSVETLEIPTVNAANDSYVEQQVRNAEMIWIAGGDQSKYRQFWMGTVLEDAINDHINIKKAPIGGTSAGMAVLAGFSYTGENGSVSSSSALSDPYNNDMTFGDHDFIDLPFLVNTITDTHYNNPDRSGRHIAFMARFAADKFERPYGIACNEYVAVYIDENKIASVYGNPAYDDYAFFLQSNNSEQYEPETCTNGTPLTWNRNNKAVKVYKILGTTDGSRTFNLNDWETGSGGSWEFWYVIDGSLNVTQSTVESGNMQKSINLYPNPFKDILYIESNEDYHIQICDITGKILSHRHSEQLNNTIDLSNLPPEMYILKIKTKSYSSVFKVIKQ